MGSGISLPAESVPALQLGCWGKRLYGRKMSAKTSVACMVCVQMIRPPRRQGGMNLRLAGHAASTCWGSADFLIDLPNNCLDTAERRKDGVRMDLSTGSNMNARQGVSFRVFRASTIKYILTGVQ